VNAALLLALCACSSRSPITSCRDDLRGTYVADGKRWMLLESARDTFEAYPLFDDGLPGPLEVAPRVIDLDRDARGALAGTVQRRFMRGPRVCDGELPVHVTACTNDTLEIVLADPQPPLAFDPCSWGRPPDTHVERWHRE